MAESELLADLRPDFYVAAIGRSGSTLLSNWLTRPPDQLVFNEPFFSRAENSRLLRIQLARFGMTATDEEWRSRNESAEERFVRLMTSRLEGKRWGFKEVLCEEHFRALEQYRPRKVLITVRNIIDVALSFFEKHRAQENLARFSDAWVANYCVEETRGILRFQALLQTSAVPHIAVRYEDFMRSVQVRKSLEAFLGWRGGGNTSSNFNEFDRGFEIDRHGTKISGIMRERQDRVLGGNEVNLATAIGDRCKEYQSHFNYDLG